MATINRNPVYDGDYVTLQYLREYLGESEEGEQVVYSKNFGLCKTTKIRPLSKEWIVVLIIRLSSPLKFRTSICVYSRTSNW